MAIDKLIDSSKETACRTAEANAIRAKTGSSASISYDFANGKGFADAISAIPTGGGGNLQTDKTFTTTQNGNFTISPDSGYDGMESVSLAVNVPASGRFTQNLNTGCYYIRGITYGDGKFVAVSGDSSKRSKYSTDGINWSDTDLQFKIWSGVAYGNGIFVAITSNENNEAAYSTDGIHWSYSTLPNYRYWVGIAYGNGRFVAVCGNGEKKSAWSTDGINWTEADMPDDYRCLAYGKGKFVAVGAWNLAYSTDGVSWTKVSLSLSRSLEASITYGNGKFVIVSNANTVYSILYSTDAVNWSQVSTESRSLNCVAYGNGMFVALKAETKILVYSMDGINWTEVEGMPWTRAKWRLIGYGGGIFVAFITDDTDAAYCDVRMIIG